MTSRSNGHEVGWARPAIGVLVIAVALTACFGRKKTRVSHASPMRQEAAAKLRARVPGLLAEGKLDRVRRVIKRADLLDPHGSPETWPVLMETLVELGRHSAAYGLAQRIAYHRQASEEARALARELLSGQPAPATDDKTASEAFARAATAAQAGDHATAKQGFLSAWQARHPYPQALAQAGLAARALGEPAVAQRLLDRARSELEQEADVPARLVAYSLTGWERADGLAFSSMDEQLAGVAMWQVGSEEDEAGLAGPALAVFDTSGETGTRLVDLTFPVEPIERVIYGPKGELLTQEGQTLTIRRADGTTTALDHIASHAPPVFDGAGRAAALRDDATIGVFDLASGRLELAVRIPGAAREIVPPVRFVGSRYLVAAGPHRALLLDLDDKLVSVDAPNFLAGSYAVSQSGRLVALVGHGDGKGAPGPPPLRLVLFDTATHRKMRTIDLGRFQAVPPTPPVLAISPDDKLVAVGVMDRYAMVVDVATGRLRASLRHRPKPKPEAVDESVRAMSAIAFTADGKQLCADYYSAHQATRSTCVGVPAFDVVHGFPRPHQQGSKYLEYCFVAKGQARVVKLPRNPSPIPGGKTPAGSYVGEHYEDCGMAVDGGTQNLAMVVSASEFTDVELAVVGLGGEYPTQSYPLGGEGTTASPTFNVVFGPQSRMVAARFGLRTTLLNLEAGEVTARAACPLTFQPATRFSPQGRYVTGTNVAAVLSRTSTGAPVPAGALPEQYWSEQLREKYQQLPAGTVLAASSPDAGYVLLPDGYVDVLDGAATDGVSALVCAAGESVLPPEACAERYLVAGSLARLMAGDTTYRDP